MFKRRDDGDNAPKTNKDETLLAPPLKPFSKHGSHLPPKAPATNGRSDQPRRPVDIPTVPRRYDRIADTDGRKLIVGRAIELSGAITSCDKLVVEGTVEANLDGARVIEVSTTGIFRGKAAVEEADISGFFDGELVATKRLIVRSTGQVNGDIRYAGIVIEPGGELRGNVQVIQDVDSGKEPPRLMAPVHTRKT
ncbi:MAG: hypothetical protein A2516_07590 [Alphaproteobacteria bacterium RIFOXYD12_FULL_60_8]|nr:MAG: hypothetical protein A2516_07590 [Alphaproteobacteria bacterium RIFOXYD12_FULL_60_8]